MTKMKQKEAVLKAIATVLTADNIHLEEGQRVELNKDQRHKVVELLFNGFKTGDIDLGTEYAENDLKAYVSSLLNNWLRKAKELNGGQRYAAKNPGSRAGQQDKMLQNLRALYKAKSAQSASTDVLDQIQKAIDIRLGEVKAAKTKLPDIDINELPEHLRSLVGEEAGASA